MKSWWILILLLAIVSILLLSVKREYFPNDSAFEYIDPTCPSGTELDAKKRCEAPGVNPVMGTCPSGYLQIQGGKCRKNGSTEEISPTCPSGMTYYDQEGEPGWGCRPPYVPGICPPGSTSEPWGISGIQCKRPLPGGGTSQTSSSSGGGSMPRPNSGNQQLRSTIASYMGIPVNNNEELSKYAGFLTKFYDEEYLPEKKVPTSDQISGWVDTQIDVPPERKPGLKSVIDYWFTNGTTPEASSSGGAVSGSEASGGAAGAGSGDGAGLMGGSGSSKKTPKKPVLGPKWTGLGDSSGGGGADSTKTNKYPELMGGVGTKSEKKEDKRDMPTDWSLGITGGSRFLPFSRQPGDMDLIPDPYRISRTFSPSSYSSKTDPVPFLNDFSAFFK